MVARGDRSTMAVGGPDTSENFAPGWSSIRYSPTLTSMAVSNRKLESSVVIMIIAVTIRALSVQPPDARLRC